MANNNNFIPWEQLFEETVGVYGVMDANYLDYNPLTEAKFSVLGKFKADPEMKDIVDCIEKANSIIKDNGAVTKTNYLKNFGALKDAKARLSDLLGLVSSASMGTAAGLAAGPVVGIIVGIIWQLYLRLIRYMIDKGNEQGVNSFAAQQIRDLEKIAKSCKDSKEKKKINDLISKMNAEKDKLDERINAKNEK